MLDPYVLDALWAKSSSTGGLPVMRHMADVSAVATALFETLPRARQQRAADALGVSVTQASSWISAIVGAHDIGKATPGFQQKWTAGREAAKAAGFSFPAAAPDRHDASTQVILKQFLTQLGVARHDAGELSASVGAHHGFRIEATELRRVAMFSLPDPWKPAQQELLATLLRLTRVAGIPALPVDAERRSALLVWLAGLCSVADWIGSNETFFPHDRRRDPYASWFEQSSVLARQAVADCGFSVLARGDGRGISHHAAVELALGSGLRPRPLQEAVGRLLASAELVPSLFVIEAPMGEGKTEAALAIDSWCRGNAGSRGIYLAMPTQATSNALFERIARYLARWAEAEPVELHLAHSGARGNAASLRLREIGYGSADGSVRASEWLAGPKRTMLAANAIGTVDQALVGVLNAKHHFVRLHGLSDRVVVLDEVHAYDTYTGGLIERLVSWLKAQGCTVVIMSATLPAVRRQALLSAWGARSTIDARYPRVTMSSGDRLEVLAAPASRLWKVGIKKIGEDSTEVVDAAVSAAARQAAVLVVVNKVDRAQRIYEAVRIRTERAILFHARFPMEDRLGIERKVISRFGKDGVDRQGFITVATQVAEQSLDVDFDFLITDLAPVDLLMQRIGRLHRHARSRPVGFQDPVALVSGLEEGAAIALKLTSRVYSDLPVLRTVAWLGGRSSIDMPEDIDAAVQWVYGDASPARISSRMKTALEKAAVEFALEEKQQEQLSELAALPLPSEWQAGTRAQQIADDDACEGRLRFGTRLGEDSALAIPLFCKDSSYSILGDTVDWADTSPVPADVARRLSNRAIRISNKRLLVALRSRPALPGWGAATGISHALALPLDRDGCFVAPGLAARLDPELGLVIRTQLRDDPASSRA